MTVANATLGGTCVGTSNSPALTVGTANLNLTVPSLPANGCSVTISVTSTNAGSNPATFTGATATESTGTGATPPTIYLTVVAEDPGFLYVHSDHLGTPRAITKPTTNQAVWVNENSEPFGNSQPNNNPSGMGAFTYNLRFPGQYADQETGTSYNYYRDYDPATGRYRQSDPIGLEGGNSTFGYANGSPLLFTDPEGLVSGTAPFCFANPAAAVGCLIGGGAILMIGGGGAKKINLPSSNEGCCTDYKRIYVPYEQKHGDSARLYRGRMASQAPTNGQQSLDGSVPMGGESMRRIGYEPIISPHIVVFALERRVEFPTCIEYYHGFVPLRPANDILGVGRKHFPIPKK